MEQGYVDDDGHPADEDFAALMALLDRMASTESWELSDDELLGRMDGYGVAIDRLHGMRLHVIRDVDRRLCEEVRSHATSDRMTLTDRTILSTAKHAVRTAKELRRFPMLQQRSPEATHETAGQGVPVTVSRPVPSRLRIPLWDGMTSLIGGLPVSTGS